MPGIFLYSLFTLSRHPSFSSYPTQQYPSVSYFPGELVCVIASVWRRGVLRWLKCLMTSACGIAAARLFLDVLLAHNSVGFFLLWMAQAPCHFSSFYSHFADCLVPKLPFPINLHHSPSLSQCSPLASVYSHSLHPTVLSHSLPRLTHRSQSHIMHQLPGNTFFNQHVYTQLSS